MKQLIKSASVYKAELPTADAMRAHLAEKPFTECEPEHIRSFGFVPVNEDDLVVEFPGGLAFAVRIDTKIIPTSAIQKETKALTDRFIQMEGRSPRKLERIDLKDAAVLSLAKTAFVKTAMIRVFHHRDTGYLIVPTTSTKLCDQITSMLVQAVGSVKTETIHVSKVKHGLTTRLKKWIGNVSGDYSDQYAFGDLYPRGEVFLAQEKRKVTVKMSGLEMAHHTLYESLSNGFEVTSLGFTYKGETEFSLTQDFKFKGIGFATTPDADDEDPYGLAATAALEVSALAAVITELCTMLAYKEDGAEVGEADATTDEAGYTRGPVSDGGMDPRDQAQAAHVDGVPIDPLHHLEGDGPDPMYDQAVSIVKAQKRASISLIQRHLRIGYNRSARLLEAMASAGIVALDNTNGGYKLL